MTKSRDAKRKEFARKMKDGIVGLQKYRNVMEENLPELYGTFHRNDKAEYFNIDYSKLPAVHYCDDLSDAEGCLPDIVKQWVDYQRLPASDKFSTDNPVPKLFASLHLAISGRNTRVRLTMASRFGDVGVTGDLIGEYGYSKRVLLTDLTDFSTEE